MGQLKSTINIKENNKTQSKIVNIDLGITMNKKVDPFLTQLTGWSLSEVRQIYNKFREKYIETKQTTIYCLQYQFNNIMPQSQIMNQFIFKQLTQTNSKKIINFFEFISILVLSSFGSMFHKINMLFIIFDFDNSGSIDLDELIVIFMCVVSGYCKLTKQMNPAFELLERYCKFMFLQTDISQDNMLSLREVLNWIHQVPDIKTLFQRFEPTNQKLNLQEDIRILVPFKRMSTSLCVQMMQLIKDFYNMSLTDIQHIFTDLKNQLDLQYQEKTRRKKKYYIDQHSNSNPNNFQIQKNRLLFQKQITIKKYETNAKVDKRKTLLSQYFDRGYDGDMDNDFNKILNKRKMDNNKASITKINNPEYLTKIHRDQSEQKQYQTSTNFKYKHQHSNSVDNFKNHQNISISGVEDFHQGLDQQSRFNQSQVHFQKDYGPLQKQNSQLLETLNIQSNSNMKNILKKSGSVKNGFGKFDLHEERQNSSRINSQKLPKIIVMVNNIDIDVEYVCLDL